MLSKKIPMTQRESPAIAICRRLLEEKAHLAIYDPKVSKQAIIDSLNLTDEQINSIEFSESAIDACDQSHCIAVLTEWDEFKDIDFESVYQSMIKPAILFDGRNLLDLEKIRSIGFNAKGIGVG